ncbi:GNAT family N-acetyltransferase [Veronia pacifica]|uniref:Acetyltransferase n=2 Tax=Veronia pacifica TaxID=1080227 RepID=A0A1C3E7L7_9GAMM|nr:GNAT family N-acetyltransferase [Veronia pacifica]ODA29226.1 acetyltransferase [Veronia pacifica]
MQFLTDDLSSSDVIQLLTEHMTDMHTTSPPESSHTLDLSGLKHPSVRFWVCRSGDKDNTLLGCVALKYLKEGHGEIKSMRTASSQRGRGVGRYMLEQLMAFAQSAGYSEISLETGTQPFFYPAHQLYRNFGFQDCPPFADYQPDPHSRFMHFSF